ncbi:hypothetical protein [Pseudomonas sp. NPDC089406]|uniref:hypothetical protein n=1 Tax=Pseudomonas sp. NPDC089406 TaxID=3364463 RepID=UPI00384FFFD3
MAKFLSAIAALLTVFVFEAVASESEIQGFSTKGDALHFKRDGVMLTVNGVIGGEGQNIKILNEFNGGPALEYENVTGGYQFMGDFTLLYSSGKVVVDCLYVNVRSGTNGMLIRKAVCGLNKVLDKGYLDTLYRFTDAWLEQVASIDTQMNDGVGRVVVPEGQIQDVMVSREYTKLDQLISDLPAMFASRREKVYAIEGGHGYTVYDVADLSRPRYIDVAQKNESIKFERLDYERLAHLLADQ